MLEWGLIGGGAFLAWCALTGRSPSAVMRAQLTGKPIPAGHSIVPGAVWQDGGKVVLGQAPERKQAIVNIALQQLGKPYKWGAEGPDSFDCSGLTKYCYEHAGVDPNWQLPRTAAAQALFALARSPAGFKDPVNGDLVFLGVPAYHVGIYFGGSYINAPDVGQVVKVSPIPHGAYFGMVI